MGLQPFSSVLMQTPGLGINAAILQLVLPLFPVSSSICLIEG